MKLSDRHYGNGTIWQRKDGTGSVEILHQQADFPHYEGEPHYIVKSSSGKAYTIKKTTLDRRYQV